MSKKQVIQTLNNYHRLATNINRHHQLLSLCDIVETKEAIGGKTYEQDNQKIIMFTSKNDNALIECNKRDTGFPRGFFCILLGTDVVFGGFYGKFDNDIPQYSAKRPVSCTFKYSGFLVMLTPYGQILTKQSANNDTDYNRMAREALDVCGVLSNQELLSYIKDSLMTLSFELIHTDDATHGNLPLEPTAILTCVSYDDPTTVPFLTYYSQDELWSFAKRFDIPCTEMFSVSSSFMEWLPYVRDHPHPLDAVEEATEACDIPIYCNHVGHRNISGSILEGLVLMYSDGSREKYKFLRYVMTTMALRHLKTLSWTGFAYTVNKIFFTWAFSPYTENAQRIKHMALQTFDQIPGQGYTKPIIEIMEEHVNDTIVMPQTWQTIIFSLGPLHTGKSKVAQTIEEQHSDIVHIDGDAVGFVDDAKTLGKVRNDITLTDILIVILRGYIPIISQGGGALLNLRAYLTTLIPSLGIEFISIVPEIDPSNREFHIDAVKRGIEAGKYPSDSIDALVERSISNHTHISSFVSSSSEVIWRTYSAVLDRTKLYKAQINKVYPLLIGCYYREDAPGGATKHITYKYCSGEWCSSKFVLEIYNAFSQHQRYHTPEKLVAIGTKDKYVGCITPIDGHSYGHITLYASREPRIMGHIVDAYNRNEETIELPDGSDAHIQYCGCHEKDMVALGAFVNVVGVSN